MANTINYGSASKPFIVTSVILLFIGSSIASIWMMSIFGIDLPQWFHDTFQLHKTLQMDGFLTLLIMGIGAAAMLVFVVMIHKSMKKVGPLPANNTL